MLGKETAAKAFGTAFVNCTAGKRKEQVYCNIKAQKENNGEEKSFQNIYPTIGK